MVAAAHAFDQESSMQVSRSARPSHVRRIATTSCALLAAAVLAAGCGGDDNSTDTGSTTTTTATEKTTTDAGAGNADAELGTILEVEAVSGELKFDKTELTAPAGKVTFRFTNPDQIPHDIAVRKGDEVIDKTDLITEDSVDLTVDLPKGDYEFICTPHVDAGMRGKLTIT
jgi:plastocyanin